MTKAEYKKKMAALKAKRGEAGKAGFKAYKAWDKADQALDKDCKAINDLETSWKKQESEAVK